ncbi:hypothetical protein ACQPYH_32105 [Kribbella sp. CA-245084]|uniref:hypothetical protein n=1 Tax=Kribbella sp. CA-245084 TaxID=3239940 RepID=UPI003D8BFFA7
MDRPESGLGAAVVVVTAMQLSKVARAELSDMLGPGYAVVDLKSAPSTANIVLTPVVSANALGILRGSFPQARILFTELHDDERGISFAGPLSRIVAQAPDGYFVAHSLDALSPVVQTEAKLQLSGSSRRTPITLSLTPGAQPTPPPPQEQAPAEQHPPHQRHRPDEGPLSHERQLSRVWWIDRASASRVPAGRWVELELVDALVVRLVGTDEPRRDALWPALVAECVVRLAARAQEAVLVDVGRLAPAIRVELEIRVQSEQVDQAAWP